MIRQEKYEMVSSEMLHYEVHHSPYESREKLISEFIEENAAVYVGPEWNDRVNEKAQEIMKTGIKYKDACHVASAIIAKCDYFISTDYRLLRYRTDEINIVNPIEFVKIMEEDQS